MARMEGVEPPTAWFVARLRIVTSIINQSLAVLAHPIPYLSYQSLVLHWQFKLAQNWHSAFCPLKDFCTRANRNSPPSISTSCQALSLPGKQPFIIPLFSAEAPCGANRWHTRDPSHVADSTRTQDQS